MGKNQITMQTKTKQQIRIEQQFLYTLAQIIEIFPQYTIAQHLSHFMRSKGVETKSVYFWNDETILRKLEAYYDELKNDLLNQELNEDEYDG